MRGRHSEKSFPCFAPQGQNQGKTELFMVADLREMQENQGFSEIRIDKSEFVMSILCCLMNLEIRIILLFCYCMV